MQALITSSNMKYLQLVSLLLVAGFSGSLFADMGSGHKTVGPIDACADISQPASLNCAPAPSARFDQQGRLWVVWSHAGHVYVNHSDDKGKSFSSPVSVNRKPEAISARGENRPKIISANGKIFVSWITPLEKRFTGHVRFSVSNDGGEHFSDPIIVNDNLDITGHRFEAIAVNEKGEVFMAWLDKRDRLQAELQGKDYHGAALYYSWSQDGGKTFQPNQKIMDHSCECCRVIMDTDDKQLPVILWRNIYGKNTRDHSLVEFTGKDSPKQVQRVSFDQWQVDACPHHGPDMDISDNRDIHLTWFNNAPDRHGLFYARRKTDGSLTEAISFGDYQAAASHPNVISVDEHVWLVWKQFDGKQASVWLQQSESNGDSWSAAKKIAATDADADYPFLIRDQDKAYLQWQTKREGFQLIELTNQ
jgi:hypothetical protein